MVANRLTRTLSTCVALVVFTSACAWMKLVSISSSGTQGDHGSLSSAISADGRYVAFSSVASNLIADDTNNMGDVFVRDIAAGTTVRVSVSDSETQALGDSSDPAISGDGRYVAFSSSASDLVAGDTNNLGDVFVRDLVAGTTRLVSVSSAGIQAIKMSSDPAISADGRYVAFSSNASNLVAGDTNERFDVFVRDIAAGTTSRVSVSNTGTQGNGNSNAPAISGDGRYVAFTSSASNLVAGDTNSVFDIFVRDTVAGTTSLVSVGSPGTLANASSDEPAIAGDGRYVAFRSDATNLVAGDTNGYQDVFVRDTLAGTTSLVSVSSSEAQGNSHSQLPAISDDGQYVAFTSVASNLVRHDDNSITNDVFVRDTVAGTTRRASADLFGQSNSNSELPDISADGRYVTFYSRASNLIGGDTNGQADVFVRANPEPSVTRIAPATLSRGTTTPVTVTGSHFFAGTQIFIGGDGVTLANVAIVNRTQISATVTVAADASLGARHVFVVIPGTGAGVGTGAAGACADCVTVN